MILMLIMLTFLSLSLTAQDLSTYEGRKAWLLGGLKDVRLEGAGKNTIPFALARLEADPHDEHALNYLTHVLDHPNKIQTKFNYPGIALALYRYWDSFTPAQLDSIKADLEALSGTGNPRFLAHGTENMATLRWCGAYLFAQMFPDATWCGGMTSRELMTLMKERLRRTFKNVYQRGYAEYLSAIYEIVINVPVEVLLECAEDPGMKAIAEAFMLYKWSLISLNNFEGTVLAPYARMKNQQDHMPDDNRNVGATTLYNWLMWGWGPATDNLTISDFTKFPGGSWAVYTAVSRVVPDEIFFHLADAGTGPFSLKSSAPTFGRYGTGVPHMVMRKVFRDQSFALGTGNFRWVPGGDYADPHYNGFNIVWSSPDRFNYIGCYHLYWNSDLFDGDQPGTWTHGNCSPFQQTAHHKNTAIVLFDIPEQDPWAGLSPERIWLERDEHAANLIQGAMLRYPESVDEKIEENGWIFLREGATYIGIKPLRDHYEQTGLKGLGLDGFNLVKSDHARTGFVFELGTEDEFGSFEAFRTRLPENELSVSWDELAVRYIDSQQDELAMRYQPGLPVSAESTLPDRLAEEGHTGLAASVPEVSINGKADPHYSEWPMIGSPWINMDHSVLDIKVGDRRIVVDWQGEDPVINKTQE